MKTKTLRCGLCAASLLLAVAAHAAGPAPAPPGKAPPAKGGRAIEGRVTLVVDGDTLFLAPGDGATRIEVRLFEIDAPEICQDWGEDARRYLGELVQQQTVRLVPAAGSDGRDAAGRTVGTLFVGDVNVNIRMVEEGHAWSARNRDGRGPFLQQETSARALRRGLHQIGSAAVLPADFRRSRGPCPAKPTEAAVPPKK